MAMKYKIGEVSKILNIPVETIRFYETKNLIKPHKDKYSKYRYYDIWDIYLLLDYKKYRDLEFSLTESLEIIQSASLENFIDCLQDKIKEAEKKAEMYRLKALKLQNYRNVLKNIPLIIDEYPIVNRPAGYYFINRRCKNGNFDYDRADQHEGYFDELLGNYTFVENIFIIRKECFDSRNMAEEFELGFTIKKKWADALEIKIDAAMQYIEPAKSIYTILKLKEKEYISPKMLTDVFSFMSKQNLKLAGDVFGNQIASVKENGSEARYMEVWIPFDDL